MEYAIFNRPVVTIYDAPCETKQTEKGLVSTIGDEGLYGHACKILTVPGGVTADGVTLGDNVTEIVTAYGYHGFVHRDELVFAGEGKLRSWLGRKYCMVGRTTDVMNQPLVEGVRLMTLERGAKLERLPERMASDTDNGLPVLKEGWARVCLVDSTVAYVRDVALEKVRFTEGALFYLGEKTAAGSAAPSFDEALARSKGLTVEGLVPRALEHHFGGSEEAFRAAVIETAKHYLGVEYRWGGKSARGIDCSGLVSMAYLQNGVLIYRDAKIVEGWPVKEIAFEDKKPGDLLFFPGHVAMYLGEGRYIHSTGAAVSGGVVINSLDSAAPDYRADLAEKLYAVGSIFA